MSQPPSAMPDDVRVVAVILAAGAGTRLDAPEPKGFVEVGGRPMLQLAAAAAADSPVVDAIVVTVPAGLEDRARRLLEPLPARAHVVAGGSTRHGSVAAALRVIPSSCSLVLCHDAARPFASASLFTRVVEALDGASADVAGVLPAVSVTDTIKRVRDEVVLSTEDRSELRIAQTPQGFRAEVLRGAHERAARSEERFTDDAAAVESDGGKVATIDGERDNFKITDGHDLVRADLMLARARRG
ncbi:MAG: 2-C-methyl-D-erythritol 4-phosphate cytidylyltransferase [Actinomycetota bacterium]